MIQMVKTSFLFLRYNKKKLVGWTLIDTKDDCNIHTKNDAESRLTISRGETTIEKDRESVKIKMKTEYHSLLQIRLFINNVEKKSEYDSMFSEGRIVEKICEGFSVTYQVFLKFSEFQRVDFFFIEI